MDDITIYFKTLLDRHGSIDIAESEFKKQLAEDEDLQAEYSEWCHQVGSSEKRGFLDFCDEFMDSQESIWDTLKDYDE